MKFYRHIFLVLISLVVFSCGSDKGLTPELYYKYMSNPDNGLVKTKFANNLQLSMKYLPPEYLAYREYKEAEEGSRNYDSILKVHTKSKAFLLTIAPDKSKGEVADIMYKDLQDFKGYKERVQNMNFNMASYITLNTDKGKFYPVLTNLENTYSTSSHRNIYIVFTDNENQIGLDSIAEIDLEYNDELFQTGINHFVFDVKSIRNTPEILVPEI